MQTRSNESSNPRRARPAARRRYAPRIEGVKRGALIQARLNVVERAWLDRFRQRTGLSDSEAVRRALALLAREDEGGGSGLAREVQEAGVLAALEGEGGELQRRGARLVEVGVVGDPLAVEAHRPASAGGKDDVMHAGHEANTGVEPANPVIVQSFARGI